MLIDIFSLKQNIALPVYKETVEDSYEVLLPEKDFDMVAPPLGTFIVILNKKDVYIRNFWGGRDFYQKGAFKASFIYENTDFFEPQ